MHTGHNGVPMKRKSVGLLLLFFLIPMVDLFSQILCDPRDSLYKDISLWEGKGLVDNLPPLRPYPAQVVKDILYAVIARGDRQDRDIAGRYLSEIEGKLAFRPAGGHISRFSQDLYYGRTGADLLFGGFLGNPVSVSGRLGVWLVDMQERDYVLPYGNLPCRDFLDDWSDIDLFGRNYLVRQDFLGNLAVGNEKLYFQSGMMRSTYGPFYDNGTILGGEAPRSGHFSMTWRADKFTYTNLLLLLTATNNRGAGRFTQKYLSLHSLNVPVTSWFELGAFETVVYGGRFEPLYLVPVYLFFHTQGMLGFPDNSFAGLSGRLRLFNSITIPVVFYVDDFHFNDFVRFKFDTKYKVAIQAGVTWTPLLPVLGDGRFKRISLDYLMVTPYTYTHLDSGDNPDDVNYQNYTHMGVNLGPVLEPNSDRLTLELLLSPIRFLDITLSGRYFRHGNASQGITDGDGTIFDPGYDEQGRPTFQDETRFLTQEVIEKTLQIGIDLEVGFPLWKGELKAQAGYTLESVWNKDLEKGKMDTIHYFTIGLQYGIN